MNNKKRDKIAKIFAITVLVIMMFQVLIPLFTSNFISDLQTNLVNSTNSINSSIDDLKSNNKTDVVTDNINGSDNAELVNSGVTTDNQ